jgi:hypothetical protein
LLAAIARRRKDAMTRRTPTHRLLTLVLAGSACSAQAIAADRSEFWPELSAYVKLTPRTRLYLDASYARGRESDERSLDLSGAIDVSLEPLLREELRTQDWQRSRFLWTRLGYTRVFKESDGSTSVAEDRLVAALYVKGELPAQVWIEGRLRADLRWIGGDYSSRERFRLEINREFTVQEHAVVPYMQVEGFYDTRYDGLSRMLYQPGVEITFDPHFRLELYFARQDERLPTRESLNAFGLVAKWYY